jgi:hypothetical protein
MKENKINGLKRVPTIHFVGVPLEEEKYKKGEAKLNESLSQGYRIVTEYQTPNGIVFSLSKHMNKYEKDPNQKSMDDYCIGPMRGGLQ